MTTQPQDKKLSYYLLVLLVHLTEYPSDSCPESQAIVDALRQYKYNFLKKDVMTTLMNHLVECIEKEQKSKPQEQMIELIIVLLRNILQVPDLPDSHVETEEVMRKLQQNTIINFIRENAMDGLIYLCQNFQPSYMDKLKLVFLEIYYHIFACFEVEWIYQQSGHNSAIQQMVEKDKLERQKIREITSGRHSRFNQSYAVPRLLTKSQKIVQNPFAEKSKIISHGAN